MKTTIMTLLTIALACASVPAFAQGRDGKFSLGFGAYVGVASAGLKSDHSAIASMAVAQEGGSFLITAGTPAIRIKAIGGLFYSASKVPQTVDLVRVGSQVEFHPLSCFAKDYVRFSPYIIGGVTRNTHKFYGLYGSNDQGQPRNNSVSEEPYLGSVTSYETMAGVGLALQLKSVLGQFLHVFVEYKGAFSFSREASTMYQNTFFEKSRTIDAGVVFGKLL